MDWITQTLGDTAASEQPELVKYLTDKGYKDPAAAIKGGYEAHKLTTRKTDDIRAEVEKSLTPAEDWDDERWKTFGQKTRTPNPEAYKVQVPDELKAFMPQEAMDAELKAAAEAGIPARWAVQFAQRRMEAARAELKAMADETARIKSEDAAALEKEWGPDKAKNAELATRGQTFAAQWAGMEAEPFGKLLAAYGIDTHPAFKKLFKFIGELSGDPKFVSGNPDLKATKEKSLGEIMIEEAQGAVSE